MIVTMKHMLVTLAHHTQPRFNSAKAHLNITATATRHTKKRNEKSQQINWNDETFQCTWMKFKRRQSPKSLCSIRFWSQIYFKYVTHWMNNKIINEFLINMHLVRFVTVNLLYTEEIRLKKDQLNFARGKSIHFPLYMFNACFGLFKIFITINKKKRKFVHIQQER